MSNLVIINGEEEFLKERAALDEASAALSDSILQFRLPEGLSAYVEEAEMTPVFGGNRTFILWDAKEVPSVLPPDELVIVVSANGKKKLKSKHARRADDFPRLKAYDDKNEVVAWILKEGARLNIDLSRVAGALFVNCGRSLRKAASEIKKLSVLVPTGTVQPRDAVSVMCFSADLTPRSVVDSICEGNPPKALAFLDRLQQDKDETGWILAFLLRHCLRQLRMEEFHSAGVPVVEAARRLKTHPFVYKKTLEARLGLWSPTSLSASIRKLRDLDVKHKRGDGSARLGLELEVIRLSEEAKNNVSRNGTSSS